MEIEAPNQMNFSASQLPSNGVVIKSVNPSIASFFNNASAAPSSGVLMANESTSVPEALCPLWPLLDHKADSGLTYNVPPAPALSNSRKRTRDFSANLDSYASQCSKSSKLYTAVSPSLGGDLYTQIQQQDAEINQIILAHIHKLGVDLEERRKKQHRLLMNALQEGVAKKLREQDDELSKLVKLNWALQEKVEALCVENQLWRELARTNEATALSLRSNLEHVLAHVGSEVQANIDDDAESCCSTSQPANITDDSSKEKDKFLPMGACRRCGEREASVLLLPCRHLCLCTSCGSSAPSSCPVCETLLSATVHVNVSST